MNVGAYSSQMREEARQSFPYKSSQRVNVYERADKEHDTDWSRRKC